VWVGTAVMLFGAAICIGTRREAGPQAGASE
jgi:hypothetical protein